MTDIVIVVVIVLIIVIVQTALLMQINHWAYWRGYRHGFNSGEVAEQERHDTANN